GIGLDAVLGKAAAKEPGALPLLSVMLETLYQRDIQEQATAANSSRTLTFASYRALGELRGAIAQRAEETIAALQHSDPDAAGALPQVLRALVTTGVGDAVTSRPAKLSQFADGSPARRLIDALLDSRTRLLTADCNETNAEVRIAHEALIEYWPRARQQI